MAGHLEPRRRYFHGAVDVSALGMNEPKLDDSGVYQKPVEASPVYQTTQTLPSGTGTGDVVLGILSPGVWWDDAAVTLHSTSAGTLALKLVDADGNDTELSAAGVSIVPGPQASTPSYAPTDARQWLVATVGTAALDADVTFSIKLNVTVPEWQ